MARRTNPATFIIFGLLTIGILARFFSNPIGWAVPIIVFGGIFLLYKFPPNRNRSGGAYTGTSRAKAKKKTGAFRVIHGNKPNDDDTPRYH